MNNRHHRIWLIATAALLVGGIVGCKQQPTHDEVPDMIEGSLRVAIAPTVDLAKESDKMGAVSRLTPSTSTTAGAFEKGDQVGLFLHDENDAQHFSTANMCYTANDALLFEPATPVFYKTYHNHGVYAYFPYLASATDAAKITFELPKEQSDPAVRIACDFLTSSTPHIKPQQIDPKAPEIPMTFYHQMTSIVVQVKNADGSPLSTDLVDMPVKVFLVERSTKVDINLIAFAQGDAGYQACTQTVHTKNATNRLANRVFLGHSSTKDIGTTMFFEGIVIPEAVVAGDTLIKIQIGKDGLESTRVFPYIPKAGDPIVTAGLTQGKEHVFELMINGTKLSVQGGEITDWGTGTTTSQEINGGGVTSTRLIFELTNEASVANTNKITQCTLTLDGAPYTGEVSYTPAVAGVAKARLTCSINTGVSFPYWFTKAVFSDAANAEVLTTNAVASGVVRIKGNPLEPSYDTVLAEIDVATKEVTPGS